MTQNLWSLVDREPYNHYFWTELVRVAEESKSFEGIVRVYSGFLEKFPLMHVYWNKWALLLHSNNPQNSMKDSVEIFERAISPGVLEASVDMWQCYCEFVTRYKFDLDDSQVKSVLERAIDCVGSDYNSDTIWSIYIRWEYENGRYDNVSALYGKLLALPIRNLDKFFQNFYEHSNAHSIERAATPIERSEIDQQINREFDNDVTMTADLQYQRMQTLIFEKKQQVYYQSLEKLREKQFFEVKIRRTYFHFTRPNPGQIANWYEYITYVETKEDINQIIHLYERCLIPCNMCPDIWIKYAQFLSSNNLHEHVESLLNRAKTGLISSDPEFQRLYGLFLEANERDEEASIVFAKLLSTPSAIAKTAVAAYYLRTGVKNSNLEIMKSKAIDVLSRALDTTSDPVEYTVIAAALAQIEPISKRIDDLVQKCTKVPLALSLCVKCLTSENNIEGAKHVFNEFLISKTSQMSLEDKEKLFPTYINFLRKNGNISEIRLAEKQYQQVQKLHRLEKIDDRREKCKDTTNLSEVLDRWILYLQETEEMKTGSQT